ncbi:uncharacterized protein [Panulirus ornatus]|uniref:uncharacterized protein n=1 Tax=Panulirus ornatus TaxID=150431 RepID=UPI003A866CE9
MDYTLLSPRKRISPEMAGNEGKMRGPFWRTVTKMARPLWRPLLKGRWPVLSVRTLLWGVGLLFALSLYLTHIQPAGVMILCDCGGLIETEERAARYLPYLMNETDPISNRTACEASEAWHPSLAVGFLAGQARRGARCATNPGLFSIRHQNLLWQEALVAGVSFLLYSAFYDDRDVQEGPVVRLLLMVESTSPPTPTCHLWYDDDGVPIATRAIRMDYLHWQERLSGHWLPFLVTCRAGRDPRVVPKVVALVNHACDPATNALRVFHPGGSQPKKDLALCHKFLFNPVRDFSRRLVEWLEAARAWGVDHVTMYEASTHPNVKKVVDYYEAEGFLTLMPWTSPGSQPSIPHLYRALYDTQRYTLFTDENVPYTDCLLRHLSTHRYVAVWDVDEFLLPTWHTSLPAMMEAAKARANALGLQPTSYLARCSYYFDDQVDDDDVEASTSTEERLPPYLHLLRHVIRSVKLTPPGVFTKSIHDTSFALGLHAHYALVNLRGRTDHARDLYHLYPGDEGHLAHYRNKCQGESQLQCLEEYRTFLVRDTTMWKHKYAISTNTTRVLQRLKLIPP